MCLHPAAGSYYNQVVFIIPAGLTADERSMDYGRRPEMFTDPDGSIEHFEWGLFQVNGQSHRADGEGIGKDIDIIAGAVYPWKGRQSFNHLTRQGVAVSFWAWHVLNAVKWTMRS